MPPLNAPITEIVTWFLQTGYTLKSVDESKRPIVDKMLKRYSVDQVTFDQEYATQTGTTTLATRMKGLIPNAEWGPLSYDQKVRIRDHHQQHTIRELSSWVRSSPNNVKLARAGDFKERLPPPELNLISDRPYGPLTYKEQVEIRDTASTADVAHLAQHFNTHPSNVRRAQRGEFPEHHAIKARREQSKSRPYGPLSYTEKVDIRDNRADEPAVQLAKEYNTNYGNIAHAQRGMFKDRGAPPGPTLMQKYEEAVLALTTLRRTYDELLDELKYICNSGDVGKALREIIEENTND